MIKRIEDFLATRWDSKPVEVISALFLLVKWWQIYAKKDGKVVAPFLFSAIQNFGGPHVNSVLFWEIVLLAAGVSGGYWVYLGYKHDNCFKARTWITFSGAVVWSVISLAVMTSEQGNDASLGYLAIAVVMWISAISLELKKKYRETLLKEGEKRGYTTLRSESLPRELRLPVLGER